MNNFLAGAIRNPIRRIRFFADKQRARNLCLELINDTDPFVSEIGSSLLEAILHIFYAPLALLKSFCAQR